jgi:hypothetical protein
VGAVGRGAVEVGFVEVELVDVELDDVEFEFVELPVVLGEFAVRVNVTGMAVEKTTVCRFWSRETPVENEVKTVTWAGAAEDALLLSCYVTSRRVVRLEK